MLAVDKNKGHRNSVFADTKRMFAYLCACAGCGYSLPPIYYLCDRCWSDLAKLSTAHHYSGHKWPVYTLWEWEKKQSLLHSLLRRRKASSISHTEKRLALWLVSALPEDHRAQIDAVFYPAKKLYQKDHTWWLAHAVGDILNLPVTAIEVAAVPRYKTLGRSQRARERLKNTTTYARYKGRAPLIVDDIMTTGTTLEALWIALGKPKRAVALCLAYKTFNPEDKI